MKNKLENTMLPSFALKNLFVQATICRNFRTVFAAYLNFAYYLIVYLSVIKIK